MTEDYRSAAKRHWWDGETLFGHERLDNADHLYGFAAECALKWALVSTNQFRANGHTTHINVLWRRLGASHFQRRYRGLAGLLASARPFDDWHVDQRYHRDGSVAHATADRHRAYTRRILLATNAFRG